MSLFTENLVDFIRRQRTSVRLWTRAGVPRLGRLLFLHASILQDIGPFAARTGVRVLEMLAEVVGAKELLGIVALAKLVHGRQVFEAPVPVRPREIGEFFAAIPARVVC